jgi:hypothetical protein
VVWLHEVPQSTKIVGCVYHLPRNTYLKIHQSTELYLNKKINRQMVIDNRFEQFSNDMIKWEATKTNKKINLGLAIIKVFLGYTGTPETNPTWQKRETNNVSEISGHVWLIKISGVVQYEDAPRTGTMELHSGKDYHCECLCSRGE